ncbi:hypothetical protein CGRA01v4_11859 [Colletotrichum graminicola]|nr:hypothetical protein CGRA01v4_11859 [Colletotrichum graminicola]
MNTSVGLGSRRRMRCSRSRRDLRQGGETRDGETLSKRQASSPVSSSSSSNAVTSSCRGSSVG